MGKYDKLLTKILSAQADSSISFNELRHLLLRLGFVEKARGSHHLFRHPALKIRLNLQPYGAQAKPYQVAQVRRAIMEHQLGDP